ncbi:MAG: hypothetical protein P4L03_09310 [Terracidiphilus sp.]|nr:hypothetical protein [Terracidiphilus sp.]
MKYDSRMKHRWVAIRVLLFVSAAMVSFAAGAQQPSCTEVHAMAEMAQTHSLRNLERWKSAAGTSYRAQVVYAFRLFAMRPQDRSAALAVLDLIPKNDEQGAELIVFDTSLCDGESMTDLQALGRFETTLSRSWARAAILLPEKMSVYISYLLVVGLNPHDDYAVQMKKVCLQKHRQFVDAVNGLAEHDRKWLVDKIFNPEGCHTLMFPEAD